MTVEALRGVSLTVNRGDFTAIMGTSGSGKTTLMNIIGCLDTPTSGTYILNGRAISAMTDDELSVIRNETIGFVFQNFFLLHYATVIENILLPTLYMDVPSHAMKEKAMELLATVGLEDRAYFKPRQLSGGQQQRAAIARALINNPALIICDEPTGALDTRTASEIMKIFTELNNRGTTIILVTHDSNIAAYAHTTVHIKDGLIDDAFNRTPRQ
ncbi:ABC transporter ATP-binding protein [Candidatus Magnetominusculus xianensis]|uniref:Macrolide ABC transporter ATP-binding protein n=1 Tax=Candidatus Magnetominusculus xianensis TaxID=1748249 RepID=A0ABR5SDC3_9BACT|nr:ABC transporter ATP-binding protein [Candidatus Magnetominusculus xianensis]KWT82937.1 macrolide ABC transporter ATP-binding protein [Candidatus Magnetominusculus xianensis]